MFCRAYAPGRRCEPLIHLWSSVRELPNGDNPQPTRSRETQRCPPSTRALLICALSFLAGCVRETRGTLPGDPPLSIVEVGEVAPTIVVLHGGPGVTHTYLRPEWDRLAQGRRVLYYDQRGCGRSGHAASYTWRDHVADLDRVLHARAPGQRVVVAGSSWGAHLALLYAMEHPERVQALVLSGLVSWRSLLPDSNRAYIARMDRLLPKRSQAWHDSTTRAQMERLMRMPQAERDAEARARVSESDSIAADERAEARDQRALGKRLTLCPAARDQTLGSLSPPPPIEGIRRVEVPTLILRGGRRSLNEDGAAAVARLVPHAEVRTLPDAGHDPWFSRPNLFFSAVDSFLATHTSGRSTQLLGP